MFIAKKDDLIILATETLEEMENALKLMVYDSVEETETKYVCYNGEYLTEEEFKRHRIAEFNKEFFNTSLGYIRRSVNMKDGSHKDFLSDLLPTITMAVNMGQEVKVIAYDMPDFDDLKPIEEYQHNETVTAQFIQECFMQLSADFGVVNESVEA